jgi:hypothetical protein
MVVIPVVAVAVMIQVVCIPTMMKRHRRMITTVLVRIPSSFAEVAPEHFPFWAEHLGTTPNYEVLISHLSKGLVAQNRTVVFLFPVIFNDRF